MANVLLTSLFPGDAESLELGPFHAFFRSAETSTVHVLVADPHQADLIFLTDEGRNAVNDICNTPLYDSFWDKCFIFSQCDRPIPLIPGLYASIQKGDYDHGWCRTGFYTRNEPSAQGQMRNSHYNQIPFPDRPKYLCSFSGSCQSAPIRERLKEICDPRCLVLDVSREAISANTRGDQIEIKRLQTQFLDLLRDSLFSLCPRGMGTNSIRLYESMAIGRAPVILSDDWRPPLEIPWETFSIRIAERDYKSIPEILAPEQHRAQELGHRARQAWEEYFRPNVIFDHAVSRFLDIRESRKTAQWREHQFRRLRMLPKIMRYGVHAARVRLERGGQ